MLLKRIPFHRFLATLTSFALLTTTSLQSLAPLAEAASSQRKIYYFHPDHLGSTTLVTDEQGQVVQEVQYKPYGEVYAQAGAVNLPHKFTGQRHDASTGLYYYNARYYDPQLGRFTQPDAFVQAPTDPQTLNRYAYARNNPVKFIDPSGHFFFLFAFAAAIFSAVASATAALLGSISGLILSIAQGAFAAIGAAVSAGGAFSAAHPYWASTIAGATAGGATGGISASQAGGNVGEGILFGAGVGALSGWAGFGAGQALLGSGLKLGGFSLLEKMFITGTEFGIAGAGIGAAAGFQGGRGSFRDIVKGAGYGFGSGFALGGATGALGHLGILKDLHGASFALQGASNPVTAVFLTAAEAAAATLGAPEVVTALVAMAAVSLVVAVAKSVAAPYDAYPGQTQGKIAKQNRAAYEAMTYAPNPAPNPVPPPNKWVKILEYVARLLTQTADFFDDLK
ncbi:MAG: RHS domain-containing protein [Candidatus Omnitrophica bacterium]|nr:RHS domain-containing protein [Candidatus Omnitrophota bacterium]